MNKILAIGVLIFTFFCSKSSFAQPQYVVQDNIGANVFPLGTTSSNKCQFLLLNSDFSVTPSAGLITKVYILAASSTSTATFTNFTVNMGLTTITTTPGAGSTPTNFITGLTTVVNPQTKTFTNVVSDTWVEIILDVPFVYDGTSNILFEMSQTSYTSGITLRVNTTTTYPNRRIYGPVTSLTGTSNTGRLNFGMDMTPVGTDDAGIVEYISPVGSYCSGTHPVSVAIENAGNNSINSLQIHWEVDGLLQPMVNYSSVLPTGAVDTVLLGNITVPASGTPMNIKSWTSLPNNVPDPNTSNDTLTAIMEASQFIVSSNTDTTCSGSSVTFNLSPNTGYAANSIQWQSSPDGLTWTDIAGANGVTYVANNMTTDQSFQVKIGTGANACTSNVKQIKILAMPTITTSDAERCGEGTVTLSGSGSGSSIINWYAQQTGGTSLASGNTFVTPVLSTNTTYYASAQLNYLGCESARVPVIATIKPLPLVDLGNDTALCSGASFLLDAGNPNGSYLWNTAATSQTINVNNPGTYSVAVTGPNNCIASDSIEVTLGQAPQNSLLPNYDLCENDSLILDAGNAGSTFLWSNTSTNQTITVNAAGNYFVEITSPDECILISTTDITMRPLPNVDLGNDTAICFSDGITLDAANPGSAFFWSTGDTSQTVTIFDAGTYSVVVTSPYGCIGTDDIVVTNLPIPSIY